MAKQDLTRLYNGSDLSGATNGVIYLPVVRDSTLEKVSVRTDAAQVGAAVFEVRKNGAVISELSAVTIANGAKIGTVSGLSIALADGDEITLNLLSGNVSAPVTLSLATDDGLSSGGTGGGNDYELVCWTKLANAKTEGTRLLKTGGTYGGASSYQKMAADGALRLPMGGLISRDLVFGLSYTDGSADCTEIGFCFFVNSGTNSIDIYESGISKQNNVGVYDSSGTVFEIVRTGTTIIYKLNGTTIRAGVCVNGSMIVDVSIFNNSSGFEFMEIKKS